jgi:hypothetical protein
MDTQFVQKLGNWNNRIVLHSSLKVLVDCIEERRLLAGGCNNVQSMAVLGEAGCGKTWLARHFLNQYPPYDETTDSGQQLVVPVLYMRMPSTRSITHTIQALLDALHNSYAKRDDVPTLTLALVRALKRARTQLVFFDEIQQLVDAAGAPAKMIKNWLKNLIDEAGIPIVFLGLPNGKAILSGDELGRRVTPIFSMSPFDFPISTRCSLPFTLKTLSDYLVQDVRLTLLRADQPIPLAQRIWAAGGGRICSVRSLVFDASLRAAKAGREDITLDDLARSYAFAPPQATLIRKGNPFEMSPDKVKVLTESYRQMGMEAFTV